MQLAGPIHRLLQLTAWAAILLAPALLLCVSFGLDPLQLIPRNSANSRPALLAWGLAILDPSLRRIAGNTAIFATLVTIPAALFGLALAEWRASCGPWVERITALALRPAILPPLILGLGLRGLVPLSSPFNALLLLAASWLWSIPLIAAWLRPSRSAVDPRWRDRGRLYGGRPGIRRAWRFEVLPVIAPSLARVSALVFLLSCLEVGAALALDIDSLLAPRALATLRSDSPALAAALALTAWLLGGLVLFSLSRAVPTHPLVLQTHFRSPPPATRVTKLNRAIEGFLLFCLILAWWLPLFRLAIGLLARLGREAMRGDTMIERLHALADATRDLPLALARQILLNSLPFALAVAALSLLIATGLTLGNRRPRLWDIRGISLIPGLLLGFAAASLALPEFRFQGWPTLIIYVLLAVPLALAHFPNHKADANQSERERLLGASRLGGWWRNTARTRIPSLLRAALAVALFVFADTTAALALATRGVDPNPASAIARSIAYGGDPDIAPVLGLFLALLFLIASAFGVRVAWYGPRPTPLSRSHSNSRTIMS